MGLASILMLELLSDIAVQPNRCAKFAFASAAIVTIAIAPWFTQEYWLYYPEFVTRSSDYNELRKGTLKAKAEYALPEDGNYLIYAGGDVIVEAVNAYFRSVKYDLNSMNIDTISRIVPSSGQIQEEIEYSIGNPAPNEICDSPIPFLTEHLDEYDAFLVLFKDEVFESAMQDFFESYTGSTPILFVYE